MSTPQNKQLFVLRHKESQNYVVYNADFRYLTLSEKLMEAFFFDDPDNETADSVFLVENWDWMTRPDNLEFELVELSGAILSVTPFSNLAL